MLHMREARGQASRLTGKGKSGRGEEQPQAEPRIRARPLGRNCSASSPPASALTEAVLWLSGKLSLPGPRHWSGCTGAASSLRTGEKASPAQFSGQGIAVCLFLLATSPVPLLAEYGRAGYTGKPWSFKTLPFGLPAGIEIVLPLKKGKARHDRPYGLKVCVSPSPTFLSQNRYATQ